MNQDTDADPIEIEIEEAQKTDDDDIVVETPAEEKPSTEVSQDDGIEALKRQLESERIARQEAERLAKEHASHAYQYQNEVQDTNLHLINNAISTLQNNQVTLKSNFRQAMENQDFEAAADIQQEMADTAAKLMQLDQGRKQLEEAPRPEYPTFAPTDPVENLASQLTPRSADWVRSHPEFATDQRMYQKMVAAHNLVVADGIAPDTDAYFSSVERVLGLEGAHAAAAPKQRQSAPPAAPVSRNGGAPGTRPTHMTLTRDERDMAGMMGMTEKEYAKHKLALIREGKLH